MIYEELEPITQSEAERLLASGDPQLVATALLRLALHSGDSESVELLCLGLATHPDVVVRRAVAMSAGHLARLHGTVGKSLRAALRRMSKDSEVAGAVSDALDDLNTYAAPRRKPSKKNRQRHAA